MFQRYIANARNRLQMAINLLSRHAATTTVSFIDRRPKSVPSSPMVKRAFSRLGTITAGWGRSIRKQHSQLNADDKKKWASSQDCSS